MAPPITQRPKDASAAWESLHADPKPATAKPHREAGEIHVAYDFKNGPASVRVTDIQISLRSMLGVVFKFYLAVAILLPIISVIPFLGFVIWLLLIGGSPGFLEFLLPS
jgi:hypothetical protein